MTTVQPPSVQYGDYNPGHPWYYVLGGPVLVPKQIFSQVRASSYQGYLATEIERLAALPEPKRSQQLRALNAEILGTLHRDLTRYRATVFLLHAYRRLCLSDATYHQCQEVHTAVSLKYCHLFNDFAHLLSLDRLLSIQADLFAG